MTRRVSRLWTLSMVFVLLFAATSIVGGRPQEVAIHSAADNGQRSPVAANDPRVALTDAVPTKDFSTTSGEEASGAPGITAVAEPNYTFTSTSGTYTEITGGTVHGTETNDDQNFNNVAIGFTFGYNGVNYTAVGINANGFVRMGSAGFTGSCGYNPISSIDNANCNNSIAALARDLVGQTGAELMSKVEGTAPDRVFIVQWKNYRSWASPLPIGDSYNFQIRLYETSNVVEYAYGSFTQNATNRTVQVGLRGAGNIDYNNRRTTTSTTGDWAESLPGTANNSSMGLTTTLKPGSGLIYTFTPAPPGPNLLPSSKSGAALVSSNQVLTYTVFVRNSGDLPTTETSMVDPIPANTTFAYSVTPGLTYNEDDNQMEWTGSVAAESTQELTFAVNVGSNLGCGVTSITNVATISDPSLDLPITRQTTAAVWDNIYFQHDLEAENGGFTVSGTNASWAWGVPTSGPMAAYSGINVWATRLNGDYNNYENSYLTSPIIDLSAAAAPPGYPLTLVWAQFLNTEGGWDFASIEARGGAQDWTVVYGPVSGIIDASWAIRTVDISQFAGANDFQFRFRLLSDDIIVRPGWYIDDIAIYGCAPPANVYVSPSAYDNSGFAGDVFTYTYTIVNLTGAIATFDINVDADWPTTAPSTVGPVADGGAALFDVVVEIPGSAYVLDSDVATIEVSGNGYSAEVTATTTYVLDRWVYVAPLPAATARLAATGTSDYLYMHGGQAGPGNALRRYDPATDSWTSLANAPGNRSNHEICEMNGVIYSGMGFSGTGPPFDSALWAYNIAGNSWSTLASVPGAARLWAPHICVPALGDSGTLFIIGGFDGNDGTTVVNRYDVAGNSWSTITPLPTPTYGADAALLDNTIYVKLGGENTVFAYDLDQGDASAWNTAPSALAHPGLYAVSAVLNGQWYLAGNGFGGDFNAAERYNPAFNAWQRIASLNTGRYHTNGGAAAGSVYAVGGTANDTTTTLATVERYLRANVSDGLIQGTIYAADFSNAPVAGATITIQPTGATVTSDANGQYTILAPERPYQMTVSADKFAEATADVILTSGGVTQDFYLDSARIQTSADALSDSLVFGQTGAPQTLTISNIGSVLDLSFELLELPDSALVTAAMPRFETYVTGPLVVDAELVSALRAEDSADFFIWMRERADLAPAYSMPDRNERRIWVFNTLRATADQSQKEVRVLLDQMGYEYEVLWINNSILVRNGDRSLVDALLDRAEIHRLRGVYSQMSIPEPTERIIVTDADSGGATSSNNASWSIQIVKADDAWTLLGVTGQGAVVANIDTGVQYTHPALVSNYRGNLGNGSYSHGYNWFAPTAHAQHPNQCGSEYNSALEPCDSNGHGTHTMGTIAGGDGNGPFNMDIGMAPDAQWMACMGCDAYYPGGGGGCTDAALTTCAQWIVAPSSSTTLPNVDPDPTLAPDVVNNSWGGGGNDAWYYSYVEAWRAADIIPVFSAGNSGPNCNTLGSPGSYNNVIGVGGTDFLNRNYTSTSRGPGSGSGVFPVQKPDIAAPGESVLSAVPGNGYASYSGTSMAAPHVAGLVALMRSVNPDLTYADIYAIMTESAFQELSIKNGTGCGGNFPDYPNYVFGHGRIDAYAAVYQVMSSYDIEWFSAAPEDGSIAPSGDVDVSVVFSCAELSIGTYTGSLLILHDDPLTGQVQLPLSLTCTAPPGPPEISVSPASLSSTQLPDTVKIENFDISNSGEENLIWSIVEAPSSCASPAVVPWLAALPDSGSTGPGNSSVVDITVDSTGQSAGTYEAVLCVHSNDPTTPLVEVPVSMIVEEAPSYAVSLTVVDDELFGMPGSTVMFDLRVTNMGTVPDTFELYFEDNDWVVELSMDETDLLEPGEWVDINVMVTIPAGAMMGNWDTVMVYAKSMGDGDHWDSAMLKTNTMGMYGVELEPATDAKSGAPGETVIYLLDLTNTGNAPDTITVGATGGWTHLPVTEFTLDPQESVTVVVHINIPAGAADGAVNVATVTAVSNGDATKTAQSTLTTTVQWYRVFLPFMAKP
jgi:uncharacterized repeat protein (TIGR01451 family)